MTTITDSQLRRTRRLRANSLPTIHISPQMLQHTRLPFIAWHLPIQHPPADTRALSWCRIHIWARSCTAPAIRRICIMRHCAHEYPHRPRLSHVHATVRSTNVHYCAEREAHLAHASAHQPHAAPPSSSSIPVGIVCLACAHVRTEYALAWHCGAPSTALRQPLLPLRPRQWMTTNESERRTRPGHGAWPCSIPVRGCHATSLRRIL